MIQRLDEQGKKLEKMKIFTKDVQHEETVKDQPSPKKQAPGGNEQQKGEIEQKEGEIEK